MMYISAYKNYTEQNIEGSDISKILFNVNNHRKITENHGINFIDASGSTALKTACKFRNIKTIKLLIEKEGIDINIKDKDGMTCLMLSCLDESNTQIIELLLNLKGIDVDARDNLGRTAFLIACTTVSYENKVFISKNAELLMEKIKIDPNDCDNAGRTALITACRYQNSRLVELLLKIKDIDVNFIKRGSLCGRTALILACQIGGTKIIKLLLERDDTDANILDDNNNVAIWYTVSSGNERGLKLLLERKDVDINILSVDEKYTPLMLACKKRSLGCVKLLLNAENFCLKANRKAIKIVNNIHYPVSSFHREEIVQLINEKYYEYY